MQLKKVCFVTPGVYPMLEHFGPYGGSELRAWRLARYLAASGLCNVSMFSYDYGQQLKLMRDGVLFIRDVSQVWTKKLWPRLRGRIFRVLYKRPVGCTLNFFKWECQAWESVDADVYVAVGVTSHSSKLANWCSVNGKRFVLILGSDMDLDPEELNARTIYELPGLLVAQTKYQRQEVFQRYGRDAVILRNPVTVDKNLINFVERKYALWVGKSTLVKGPDRMVELAHLCPAIPIIMILNKADIELFNQICDAVPTNVQIIETVAPEAMSDYYKRAFALISTSRMEGFANSFLEAGACGTPVLSMNVDPDGFITVHGGGLMAGELSLAAVELNRLYESRHWMPNSLARNLGLASFQYVAANHENSLITENFINLINSELEMVS